MAPASVAPGSGTASGTVSEAIRIRGLVQGVGLRPTVWRLATRYALSGWVSNDGEGVNILASGSAPALQAFVAALYQEAPPLARIHAIERRPAAAYALADGFHILDSGAGQVRTGIVPDAAPCTACAAEIEDPAARRYRHPFANCTHCGPRLTIIEALPYDRGRTTMRGFVLCEWCRREYQDPADRRFHAQPIACPQCGPQLRLVPTSAGGAPLVSPFGTFEPLGPPGPPGSPAALASAVQMLQAGAILAIKGVGGYQFACDARDRAAVSRLRQLKGRECKPFALLARDVVMVRRYCHVSVTEAALLRSAAAPIVLLRAREDTPAHATLDPQVAPALSTLGFMLAPTPLHRLLMRCLPAPLVLTSGNRADEPQCTDDAQAQERFDDIVDALLLHDRPIARRVDDSVVRVSAGVPRLMRRARGYAPAPLRLAPGFTAATGILAMGAEQKNTFCLLREGEAIVSHHIGGLHEARTYEDYRRALDDYLALYEQIPRAVVVDRHPEYLSRKLGLELAERMDATLIEVQHHHAHMASCLAENGIAPDAAPILGVVLDGLGWGGDDTLWGGEVLLADYRGYRRLASLAPVAMPGAAQAIREPWRSAYAHLREALGPESLLREVAGTPLYECLLAKPLTTLDAMMQRGVNSPRASSCGRLFDAVAATLGICVERACFEAQPAMELEALAARAPGGAARTEPYLFAMHLAEGGLVRIEAAPMWRALLADLAGGVAPARIAMRFHVGLAQLLARLLGELAQQIGLRGEARCVALSGGVFQNALLLGETLRRLADAGFRVLTHSQLPANDAGLSLGQAAVAAARLDRR